MFSCTRRPSFEVRHCLYFDRSRGHPTYEEPEVVRSCTAIVASVLATWSRRARYIGRLAVGVLMLLGGAVFNAVNLALGGDYAGFAD